MNSIPSPRTETFARRALPTFAILALVMGLAACQTPPEDSAAPAVHPQVAPQVQKHLPGNYIPELRDAQAAHHVTTALPARAS